MCHPTPGPRCARHLRQQITATEDQIAANRVAVAQHQPVPHPDAHRTLARLREEYDETRTGQAELVAKINALENSDDPYTGGLGWDLDILLTRLHHAGERRAAKLAALASTEAGDHAAAALQMKHGAHAGWLARTPLAATAPHGLSVHPSYAVVILDHEQDEEHYGYAEATTEVLISRLTCGYAAPVIEGPDAGTWLVGTTQENPSPAPVLIDTTANTVVGYDPTTRTTVGTPVSMCTKAGLALLDPHDGWALRGSEDEDRTTMNTVTVRIASLAPDRSDQPLILHAQVDLTLVSERHAYRYA